jgi:hypothetical protein
MSPEQQDNATKDLQILKCRDDPHPLNLKKLDEAARDGSPVFELPDDARCSWAKPGESFGPETLRPRIEPWLTALCQSDHLSLLLGSGLSHAVHYIATKKTLPGMAIVDFGDDSDLINSEAKRSAAVAGRGDGNIEDQIRVASELIAGLNILGSSDEEARRRAGILSEKLAEVLTTFALSILQGERSLLAADEHDRDDAFNYLVSCLMSFASRTGTRDRLHIFTTNYDRFIEAGAEVAGLHLLDRFVGSVAPVFRASRLDIDMHYNPPGIRGEPRYLEGVARFTKLHGSIDWLDCKHSIRRIGVPFGARHVDPYLDGPDVEQADAMRLMIYPNAAKDRETSLHPYVELFRDLAAAVCRPNHTLVVLGYGFGDQHINRIIEDMVTIPSTHLVVLAHSDPLGRIMRLYEKLGRHAQISLLVGDHFGDLRTLVDHYLPKPAIDRTTFRMSDLLKARWTARQDEPQTVGDTNPTGEEGAT